MDKKLDEAENLLDEAIGAPSPIHGEALDDYFHTLDEKNLVEQVQGTLNEYNAMLREQILQNDRIDILAEEVLNYDLNDHHEEILYSQQNPLDGRQITLAFRGAGKSTVGTIVRCIYEILKNPNIRILIASNTQIQAEIFLREIKEHFEANDKFIAIFGNYVGSKWDAKEIVVPQRTKMVKESTITCIGVGGPTASRHYDLIIGDDLVDEENSRTELQRERLLVWHYKSLLPTLEPDGRLFYNGTCWHPNDLYAYILKNTPRIQKLIIKAIRDDGTSAWPERWPIDKLLAIKAEFGVPVFETQYQMNTTAMEGKIFSYDSFHWYETLPTNMIIFQGCDLAIGQKDINDYFAFCTIGVCTDTNKKYVIDIHRGRYKFQQQRDYIVKKIFQYDPIRCGIEANAYQGAQVYEVQDQVGKKKAIPIYTLKDKKTRAMKLSAKCENEDILFHKSQMHLVEELLAMPDGDNDDMFDALDIAFTTATTGVRKKRNVEPGLF